MASSLTQQQQQQQPYVGVGIGLVVAGSLHVVDSSVQGSSSCGIQIMDLSQPGSNATALSQQTQLLQTQLWPMVMAVVDVTTASMLIPPALLVQYDGSGANASSIAIAYNTGSYQSA